LPSPKNSWSVSLVGAGRVGSTLAALLVRKGHRIASVISGTPSSARLAGRVLKASKTSTRIRDLADSTTLLIIATPDELIGKVAADAARIPSLRFEELIVFHTSGAMTSDALGPLSARGARAFSLHPIQTFPSGISLDRQVRLMKGTWYGFEGNFLHVPTARDIVRHLGGEILSVPKEEKILYHAACVFAANYPTVLLGAVERLASTVGLPGLHPFAPLVETALKTALSQGAGKALTGPVVRGSAETVRRHRDELRKKDPAIAALYTALGLFAVRVAGDAKRISPEQIRTLTSILSEKQ
jgi:predicted short-subunit dehydrogenase-like oxidoreductase (DUF2520 family)